MSELKHTPEPWIIEVDADNCTSIEAYCMTVIPGLRDAKHDLERIVACVNALSGISNPNEFVQKAKEALSWQE